MLCEQCGAHDHEPNKQRTKRLPPKYPCFSVSAARRQSFTYAHTLYRSRVIPLALMLIVCMVDNLLSYAIVHQMYCTSGIEENKLSIK